MISLLKVKRKELVLLFIIFLLGFALRIISTASYNTIIGFDQARDLFSVNQIIKGDIKVIGPTAGNNPNLHHGVAYLYYLLLPLLAGGGNPMWAIYWNLLFNAGVVVILYFLGKSLFNSKVGSLAAFLAAISYQLVNFGGWLSNPSPALWSVPLFFLFFWKKRFSLAAFFLGLSIQFELFLVYLIPTVIILWLVLKPKRPNLKLILSCLVSFTLAVSTMLATEIKFGFAGARSLLTAGEYVGGGKVDLLAFFERYLAIFSLNLTPQDLKLGIYLGVLILFLIVSQIIKTSSERKGLLYLVIYLLSPALMLLVGYHYSPWFLIGLPPAVILATAYTLSKLKFRWLIILSLVVFTFSNTKAVFGMKNKGQVLLEPDPSAILSTQLAVIDYTYLTSDGKPFAVNTVTNPLYINAVWAYHYQWYGKNKYGFVPGWLGGDQLPPYNTLPKSEGKETLFFLIMDQTPRIPTIYIQEAVKWAKSQGKLTEEKDFLGIKIQTYYLKW